MVKHKEINSFRIGGSHESKKGLCKPESNGLSNKSIDKSIKKSENVCPFSQHTMKKFLNKPFVIPCKYVKTNC